MSDDIFSEARTHENLQPDAVPDDRKGSLEINQLNDPDKTLPGDGVRPNPTIPRIQIGTAFRSQDPMHLPVGQIYADFFIVGELGRGTFGVVYLAEQISLKRTVALKVTDSSRDDGCGFEGRTMAQLEHPSIVRIYQELHDETKHRRLLCMQYVPGTNLRKLISQARKQLGNDWRGQTLLDILNKGIASQEAIWLETALADQAIMSSASKLEAICWIGEQTASALEHAHRRGYIHRDVKPANTIINRFGRPMLVDFNLAIESAGETGHGIVGGTIPYMSPEAMRALAANRVAPTEQAMSGDIYALSVMLWELACGEFPFESRSVGAFSDPGKLKEMLDLRKVIAVNQRVDPTLAKVLKRGFHFDLSQRYSSALELGQALRGVIEQSQALEVRSRNNWLSRRVLASPKTWLLIAGFLPHVMASALQISYNLAQIVDRLTPEARAVFEWLLFWINPIVYGICAIIAVYRMNKVLIPWEKLRNNASELALDDAPAREKLLAFPRFVALIGGLGWLGAGIAFPAIIYFGAQRFSLEVWLHFVGSFAISGATAVTFSYCLLLAVVVYAIYPEMFNTPAGFKSQSQRQIGPLRSIWPRLSMLAGGIPLLAVILLIANFRPADLLVNDPNSYREIAFKSLVIGLILASAVGFGFVRRVGQTVTRMIDRCIGYKVTEDLL